MCLAGSLLASACGSQNPMGAPQAPTPTNDSLSRGESVYRVYECASCHEPTALGRIVAPSLAHIGSVAATRRPGMSAEDYIRESILDPYAHEVPRYEGFLGRSNPGFLRSDVDVLVEYLLSLK